MNSLRFGLCCYFKSIPITYKTTTATSLLKKENRIEILNSLILHNLASLQSTLELLPERKIFSFRINSELLPFYTHPEVGYAIDDLPGKDEIYERFAHCKKCAEQNNIRLTFHPDQFVVLSSPKEQTVQSSIFELEYHGLMAELVGADIINIHLGGTYGDKKSAIQRFESNFQRLSKRVQERLSLENDDRSYTPSDLFTTCQKLKIPLVYDIHHHRCLNDTLSYEEATQIALKTWYREPLFHISSPLHGWESKDNRPHHDYIDIHDFPLFWLDLGPLTVEVEAKAKELAIEKLQNELPFLG
jgi:UV DNA damage endonuclease